MIFEDIDIETFPAPKPDNMENFGRLQYIIDKLPADEQVVVTAYFVHGMPKAEIAELTGKSAKVINRILRNLKKLKRLA